MPSPFWEAAAEASAAVDDWHGEEFLITPMRQPTGGRIAPAPDPDRAPITVVGAFIGRPRFPGAHMANVQDAEETGRRPGYQGQEIVVSLDAAALPWRPRSPDAVLRADTGETFAVLRVADGQGVRLRLILIRT